MNDFLYNLHSGVRWLVVLATIIALIYLLLGVVQRRPYDQLARRIMIAFSGLITLQWVIGLILFIVLGGFDVGYRWEHAVTMTLAVAASHMHNMFKNRPDTVRYRSTLILVLVTLALVYIGVARLPQGWMG